MRGSFDHDPQRRKAREGELQITEPLGPCPACLDEAQRARFEELRAMFPWLRSTDALLVEQTAILWALQRSGKSTGGDRKLFNTNFRLLGGTPADITKVRMPDVKQKTKLSKFA